MFEVVYRAKVPIIGVQTDDLVNFDVALQLIAGMKVGKLPSSKTALTSLAPLLYWTDDLEHITTALYKQLVNGEHQVVVINPDKPHPLVFDAGVLPTPDSMIRNYLLEFSEEANVAVIMTALKGLSLKTASEVVQITMARTGGMNPVEIRRTRTMVGGGVQGLYPVDTDLDFYVQPLDLKKWLAMNENYFLNPQTPLKLVPRGLMLDGAPGVGKTMGAKEIARFFKIPLYRLDIATTLNKYIGESESRIGRSLSMLERESPCVMLIDEAEKIFGGHDESGVTSRILSQLLWWLGDHKSRILTVMTTNDLKKIPVELYRPGRIDRVIRIEMLTTDDAKAFAREVYKAIFNKPAVGAISTTLNNAVDSLHVDRMSHSDVTGLTYQTIKLNNWLPK